MKLAKDLLLFFTALSLASCINKDSTPVIKKAYIPKVYDLSKIPDTVYNVGFASRLWEKYGLIPSVVIDTACINGTKRAEKHLKQGKLIYFRMDYTNGEMEGLLLESKITLKDFFSTCFQPPPGFKHYCYQERMNEEVYARVGASFIDSLWLVAEKQMVLKYPDSLFIKDGIILSAADYKSEE